jgi:hypothetical protein
VARPTLLLFLLILSPTICLANQESTWQFEVLLDNKIIGDHQFTVTDTDLERTVVSAASFDVKVLFLNLYRYRHANTERWQGDCLRSIETTTDANGKSFAVSGEALESEFIITTLEQRNSLNGCVMTFAYWDRDFLEQPRLLNAQTGEYESVNVREPQEDTVRFNNVELPAYRVQLETKKGVLSLWYGAEDNRWLALESITRTGRKLSYRPVKLPEVEIKSRLSSIGY